MICDKYISKILGVSHVCLFFLSLCQARKS